MWFWVLAEDHWVEERFGKLEQTQEDPQDQGRTIFCHFHLRPPSFKFGATPGSGVRRDIGVDLVRGSAIRGPMDTEDDSKGAEDEMDVDDAMEVEDNADSDDGIWVKQDPDTYEKMEEEAPMKDETVWEVPRAKAPKREAPTKGESSNPAAAREDGPKVTVEDVVVGMRRLNIESVQGDLAEACKLRIKARRRCNPFWQPGDDDDKPEPETGDKFRPFR